MDRLKLQWQEFADIITVKIKGSIQGILLQTGMYIRIVSQISNVTGNSIEVLKVDISPTLISLNKSLQF